MRHQLLLFRVIVGICCMLGLYTACRRSVPSSDFPPHTLHEPDESLSVNRRPESTVSENADHALRRKVTASSDEKCEKRLPQCLIIGTARSGTTTLLTFLGYHPQIAAIDIRTFKGDIDLGGRSYQKELDWYRHHMPCSYSHQVVVEKSVGCFFCPVCPKRIYDLNRDMKLLLIVKDPITQSVSDYIKKLDRLRERQETTAQSIEDLMMDPNTGQLMLEQKIFSANSNYTFGLRYWLTFFSMEQILVLDGHAFISNPASELRRVEKYLGIEPFFQEDQFVYNSTKGQYCFKRGQKIECMPESKGTKHPELSPELLKMKKLFHPMNEEFYRMIGRRFDWGY